MGSRDPNRQPRLNSISTTPPGWLRLATCHGCGHVGVLPAELLIRRKGELALLDFAMMGLRCTVCRRHGATASMVRLCDPSCPRIRVSGL